MRQIAPLSPLNVFLLGLFLQGLFALTVQAAPKPSATADASVEAEEVAANPADSSDVADAEDAGLDQAEALRLFEQSLNFKSGSVQVGPAKATLNLNSSFHYLEAADARRVLEDLWGNPPDDSVLGMIVPKEAGLTGEHSWAVVVTYSDDGHVSDAEANEIDYDDLLAQMQEETADENPSRIEAGYGSIELRGWAEPPHYDAASHKLYWAKELVFEGEYDTLNYDVRVLGRHGYLSLNAIADMEQVDAVREGMRELLPLAQFDAGATYADFDESRDRIAGYGLAALVGGGLAAKSGLLGKLLALLVAAKKLIVPLILGGFYAVTRLFKGKKDSSSA